ncbi:MAG: hypothetical protein US69_C0007G0075 [candidate division TM6 bacterium GW2011_GWF2_38_10]|nr:MAG: hypothetical protein US69_C0007G0075 [candidate division TM6 bacterium GW2011_GWF2_38_10]
MIAVIAGTGRLPIHACQNLIHKNEPFFVISLFPQNNEQELRNAVDDKAEVVVLPFFKVQAILDVLKKRHTTKLLFIGKVDKQNLLSNVKLDWLALKLLASILCKSDSAIMEKLISELEKHGISVISQADVLGGLMVEPGVLCGSLNKEIAASIELGITTAIKLSECDIGQTVIVKDKMVLALEAIEGTDACIQRGIALGKNNIVICKAARANQNKKFDLPTLGPSSLESLQKGDVAAIAWLSTHTFIADKELFIQEAKKKNITLVSYEPPLRPTT